MSQGTLNILHLRGSADKKVWELKNILEVNKVEGWDVYFQKKGFHSNAIFTFPK